MVKKLKRSDNKLITGVVAGIAEYLEIDPTIVRIVWAIATISTGFFLGIVAYFVCLFVMPQKNENE